MRGSVWPIACAITASLLGQTLILETWVVDRESEFVILPATCTGESQAVKKSAVERGRAVTYRIPRGSGARARAPRRLAGLGIAVAPAAVRQARTIRRHRDAILAAIRLGLSNGRLEGLNSRIGLISHRSFGLHSAQPLIALVYLCCSGIVIDLPR